jgi:hypothetical protein
MACFDMPGRIANCSGGQFEFKHIAPGKYLLHTREAAEKEANDNQACPIVWEAIERHTLSRSCGRKE